MSTSAAAATREVRQPTMRGGALYSFALAAACYVTYWLIARCCTFSHGRHLAQLRAVSDLPVDPAVLTGWVGRVDRDRDLILTLTGRPGDIITAGITTSVVMVVAALAPDHAWQQPILRLVDTAIGITVGFGASYVALQIVRRADVIEP